MAHAARGPARGSSFGLMKFVSWGTLVLVLCSSLFLSLFLASEARQVLLTKQHEFARLWAETLNYNISRRFSVPVFLRYGEVNLANPDQYALLDNVVRSVVEDFPVQEIRIYDLSGVVGYALDKDLVGREGMGGEAVTQAMGEGKLNYEFIYQTGPLGALFSAEIAPRSVVMRTIAPLRFRARFPGGRITPDAQIPVETGDAPAQQPPAQPQAQAERPGGTAGEEAPPASGAGTGTGTGTGDEADVTVNEVIGALEFTQDITQDYQKLVTFQRIIVLSALGSSLALFLILRMLFHRADRINAQHLREREAFEREIMQNEKLVSMGRMVAGIAHEIRNPLGIIRSSSELLVSRTKDKDPLTAKILVAINEEAVRLSKTVGDFLDYARPRTLKLEPVDLAHLLDQALTFLEQKCRDMGVATVREYDAGLTIQADRDLLYRAIYNILVNAMEAMADSPLEGDMRGQIVVRAAKDDKGVLLTVLDTGPGIPADIRDKLLDPFFTTKASGTGLGLAITANILRSHGAEITLGDNPGGGARVDIRFART